MTGRARIAFVVAMAENGVIGREGGLPWRLPSDLKRFRRLTLGKPVIMGRKTFASIGRPLDGRDNIVVTHRTDFSAPGVHTAGSVGEAIALGRWLAAQLGAEEVMVIGGADIFRSALAEAERIYLTLVHAAPEGDIRMDPPDPALWREVCRQAMPRTPADEYAADFIVLDRQA